MKYSVERMKMVLSQPVSVSSLEAVCLTVKC